MIELKPGNFSVLNKMKCDTDICTRVHCTKMYRVTGCKLQYYSGKTELKFTLSMCSEGKNEAHFPKNHKFSERHYWDR